LLDGGRSSSSDLLERCSFFGALGTLRSLSVRIVVSSASGANGNGRGTLLAFDLNGHSLGTFAPDAGIVDPRGLHLHPDGRHLYVNNGDDRVLLLDERGAVVAATVPIKGLNPGGGFIGPDGHYCVGSRTLRTIFAFSSDLSGPAVPLLPTNVVTFPRGCAFSPQGGFLLAEGATGATGASNVAAGVILAISPRPDFRTTRLVDDEHLSPLDLTLAPNGNFVTSSEVPFGSQDAMTSVREYETRTGKLVRVFRADGSVGFQQPRGLRFAPDGRLFCVARDEVVAFDFTSTKMLGAAVRLSQLHGQALEFFPRR
jgi:DNA-binding beta-propeller fold protein YncE